MKEDLKMTESELSTELKTGTLGGMYFFYGDEDYMKNYYTVRIRTATVEPETESFNSFSFVFGEKECDISALTDALAAPPMMSDKKFVSVFFSSFDSLTEKQKTAFYDLCREYSGDYGTVVVISANSDGFDAGTGQKPSAALKEISKIMKAVAFPLQSDAKLCRWMERHFAGYGLTVDSRIERQILDTCGRSMYRLTGEIAKVAAHAASAGKTAVDGQDVAECVIRTDSDDAFALANCIMNGDTAGALSCLQVKMRRKEDPVYILGQVAKVFSDLCAARAFIDDGRDKADYAKSMKMNEYRAGLYYRSAGYSTTAYLAGAMEKCRDADRLLKSGVSTYMPIERLICTASK